jgi:hypothetical protein
MTRACSITTAIILGLMFGGLLTLLFAIVWTLGWG